MSKATRLHNVIWLMWNDYKKQGGTIEFEEYKQIKLEMMGE